MNKRLAILTSHPIQYNAPLFKELAKSGEIELKVFYTWGEGSQKIYDPGFRKEIVWDIPLLDGYDYTFVKNTSKDPGTHHFFGIKNPDLIKEIKKWKPTAILVYGWCLESHLRAMFYFKRRIPVYFRGDSTLLNHNTGLKTFIRTLFLKFVYRYVDFAFYVGTNNKKYFLKHGLKENHLHFVPHCVDNTRFSSSIHNQKASELRSELGIKPTDKTILYAGKLEPVKNVDLLLQAFTQLNIPDVHLIIVGNGVLETELKTRYQRSGNIHFLGFQNQSMMPVIYRMGDIFVLPSFSETWGLSVNEAMASGKAILVSDKVGCAIDLIEPNKNGQIFRSGDLNDLLEKLTKSLTGDLKKMGEYSEKTIQNWSVEKAAYELISYTNKG